MCVSCWLVIIFDEYSYGIVVRIDKLMELSLSDRYFEVYRDENIGGLVSGVQDGINDGVR